jgi:hypothetical protein
MKKICAVLIFLVGFTSTKQTNGQTLSATQLNWDYLDFLPSTVTSYTTWYASLAVPYTQNFGMGPRRLTFTMSPATNFSLNGENNNNTAHVGSFATDGDDVEFVTTTTSNRIIDINLDTATYTDFTFSMFDVDNSQRITVTAVDNLGANLNVTISLANPSSGITLGGTPTAPTATGPGVDYAATNNYGTINVTIAGRVKQVIITLGNAAGDVFLSDINSFVYDTWVNNWRNLSRPFNSVGSFPTMPGYIITVVNKRIVMLDPATGRAKDIYTDPSSYSNNLNGFCYDPYYRKIYYTYSLSTAPWNTKALIRYNIDTEVRDTLIANINNIGVPTYRIGVESGAASFYNGAMYFGVEGTSIDNATGLVNYGGREHTVWRIDFDATSTPYRSTQVYSTKSDSLSAASVNISKHDWSDIGVTNNNMLYDFDGARGDSAYFHYNLLTGQRTHYFPAGSGHHYPKQTAVNWAEEVYNMGDSARNSPSKGFIVPYNYNGTVNSAQLRTVTVYGTSITGTWGDCGEAFRPLCDFGDAPASYDPDPWSPAVHEKDDNLRLGNTFDREWNKTPSADCNADGSDEDGISYAPILAPGFNMNTTVSVYNNTGRVAYLQAWVDLNGNGTFDSAEACAYQTINSMVTLQSIPITWPAAQTMTATVPNGSYTYIRIRLIPSDPYSAPVSYPSNYVFPATGYFDGGETEDYRTIVDNYPLSIDLLNFEVTKLNAEIAHINWRVIEDATTTNYTLERSENAIQWEKIYTGSSNMIPGVKNYMANDYHPLLGLSYYRLSYKGINDSKKYSDIRTIFFDSETQDIRMVPNPAKEDFNLLIHSNEPATPIHIKVVALNGNIVFEQKGTIMQGKNKFTIPISPTWAKGIYMVHINNGAETKIKKLIIN